MPSIELLHQVFAWPGIAVLCGVIPLACAALLVKMALKNWRVRWVAEAPFRVVSTLQPDLQPVRLKGRIAGLTQPLTEMNMKQYAVLGVHVEDLDEENGWQTRLFRFKTTPFWLDDGTGLIVVDPDRLDREYLGEGTPASKEQMEEVMKSLDCSPKYIEEPGLRFRVWELGKDQLVTVVGPVFEREGKNYIAKAENRPLVISSLDETDLGLHSIRQAKLALFWAAILGVPGLIVLLLAGREIIKSIGRLVGEL